MDGKQSYLSDWQNTSQCIECIYNAAFCDSWSVFSDKVAKETQSNKVLLLLENQQNAERLIYSYKTNLCQQTSSFTPTIQSQEIINLNTCIRLYPTSSLLSPDLAGHCYFCRHNILVEENIYQMLFAVSKSDHKTIYTHRELVTLLYLLPHLIQSLKSCIRQKVNINNFRTVQNTVGQGSKGIVLCDNHAKIIFVNQFMSNQLINNNFMKLVNNELVLLRQYENKRFNQQLHQISEHLSPEVQTLTLDDEKGGHALISITPLANKISFNGKVATTSITIDFEQLMNWQLIVHEYQLTAKELILLKALYHNKKLHQLPETLGVTVNTLRTHLQSVFHKTHTNSQTELMIRLSMFKY